MRLSAAGRQLVGPARQILRAMDDARNAISGATELRTGTLELATLATLAIDPLAELVGRFRDRYPGIEVNLFEPETAAGVSALVREGACELGAAHIPIPAEGLVELPLGEQELFFVLPPREDGDRAQERSIGARELAGIPLVVAPRGTSTRMLLDQALDAVGAPPRIAVQTAAREAIVPLVLSGAGATLLPGPLARDAQRRGAIVRRGAPRITRRIGLVHRDGPLSAAARAFLEIAV
jgi:DNA-binding transcriptional LysR family regulator